MVPAILSPSTENRSQDGGVENGGPFSNRGAIILIDENAAMGPQEKG